MTDGFATEDELRGRGLPAGARHYRAFVGAPERYDELAALQFGVAIDRGLREHHSVLDVGCGSLRLGRLLLPFLLPGRYAGVEPEEWLIHEGLRHELGESITAVKKPQFCSDAECDYRHFGRAFDYIVIQSVVTHAPLDWVERCAARVSAVLAVPGGVVIGTYLDGPTDYRGATWAYPDCIPYRRETLVDLFSSVGLTWRTLDQIPHPAGVTWFLLSR